KTSGTSGRDALGGARPADPRSLGRHRAHLLLPRCVEAPRPGPRLGALLEPRQPAPLEVARVRPHSVSPDRPLARGIEGRWPGRPRLRAGFPPDGALPPYAVLCGGRRADVPPPVPDVLLHRLLVTLGLLHCLLALVPVAP